MDIAGVLTGGASDLLSGGGSSSSSSSSSEASNGLTTSGAGSSVLNSGAGSVSIVQDSAPAMAALQTVMGEALNTVAQAGQNESDTADQALAQEANLVGNTQGGGLQLLTKPLMIVGAVVVVVILGIILMRRK